MRGRSNLLAVVMLLITIFPTPSAEFSECLDLKQAAVGDHRDAKGEGFLKIDNFILFPYPLDSPVRIRKEPLAGGKEFTGLDPDAENHAVVWLGRVENNGHLVQFDKAMFEYVSLAKNDRPAVGYWTDVTGNNEFELVRDWYLNNEPISEVQVFTFNADAGKNINLLLFSGAKTLIGQVCFHRVGISQQMFDIQNFRRSKKR
jgi:hypothetical protein